MFEEKPFKRDKLVHCTWQYQITHKSASNFKTGDIVFLKSNPEFPIEVSSIDLERNKVGVKWKGLKSEDKCHSFVPEVLLQYKYACLVFNIKNEFTVCLN